MLPFRLEFFEALGLPSRFQHTRLVSHYRLHSSLTRELHSLPAILHTVRLRKTRS